MKLSKVLHIASVVAGVLGVLSLIGLFGWGGGMMDAGGMMGGMAGHESGQMMHMGGVALLLVAIWLQIGAIHHMMLEKKGEVI